MHNGQGIGETVCPLRTSSPARVGRVSLGRAIGLWSRSFFPLRRCREAGIVRPARLALLGESPASSEEEMLKWMCVAAASLALAAPALAQKTDLPDRPAKQTTAFDITAMKEGNSLLKANGACSAQYIVGADGRAKDITVDCTHADMTPYVVRTIETGVWDAEVLEGEFLDSFPMRQAFNYGTGPAGPDPRGEKPPVLVDGLRERDITNAIAKIDQEGVCDVKYTVGANGKPKDVQPNCAPPEYNELILAAMAKVTFTPAQKDGAPADWPGLSMPIKLTKPKG